MKTRTPPHVSAVTLSNPEDQAAPDLVAAPVAGVGAEVVPLRPGEPLSSGALTVEGSPYLPDDALTLRMLTQSGGPLAGVDIDKIAETMDAVNRHWQEQLGPQVLEAMRKIGEMPMPPEIIEAASRAQETAEHLQNLRYNAVSHPPPKPRPKPASKPDRSPSGRWSKKLADAGWTPVATYFLHHYHRLQTPGGMPANITTTEAMVLLQLFSHKWDQRPPMVAVGTIAKRLRLNPRTIRDALKKLEGLGLLRRDYRPERAGLTKFHLDGLITQLEALLDADTAAQAEEEADDE